MGAFEDPRQELRQELELADGLEHDHLQQAVVEHRVRRRAHPAAVGLRVAGSDRVGREAEALAGRIELDLEARRAPRRERAQRAVGIHEVAEPRGRLVGDAVGDAVEADRGDPDERLSCHLAQVHRARDAAGDHRARRNRILGDPEHAREVVAATAGEHAEHGAGEIAQHIGDDADQAVAAEHHDRLTGARALLGQLAGVVEVARVDATHLQPLPAQRPLDIRRDPPGFAAAGRGVDDQADGSGHRAIVLGPGFSGAWVGRLLRAREPCSDLTASTLARACTRSPDRDCR